MESGEEAVELDGGGAVDAAVAVSGRCFFGGPNGSAAAAEAV